MKKPVNSNSMKPVELKKKFLTFFKKRGHAIIQSAPLIPENDPSALFISAGMHPLKPFLMGQPHPMGKRITNIQKCLRTGDIEEVGDDRHNTFFEMMGNWSLGDYFKKESLTWSHEFLIKVLGFKTDKMHVTVFAGDDDAPRDEESAKIWLSLGIPKQRIHYLPKEDNFWFSGDTGPCGPDSEIFIDTGLPKCGKDCRPGCDCSKYLEIWNNVFMTYNKKRDGSLEELKQKNIDTGIGVERTITILEGKKTVYDTEVFKPILKIIKDSSKNYNERSGRIIADHARAATFILGDEVGVMPSNNDQGYILRRLIRRAIRHARVINADKDLMKLIAKKVITIYGSQYPILKKKKEHILKTLINEEERFLKTLEKGLRKLQQLINGKKELCGEDAFLLFQSYGFPIEMTEELAAEQGVKVDVNCFKAEYEKHQRRSRKGSSQRFKGGLADKTKEVVRLHTATHLLAEALRQVLKKPVKQRGSNITIERLRFDFTSDRRLTKEEIEEVERLVNEVIKKGLPVNKKLMTYREAKKLGAECEFEHNYGDKVYVYKIGQFSKEVCGGPHVKNTKELGKFKIIKQESVGAGVKRIKAVLN